MFTYLDLLAPLALDLREDDQPVTVFLPEMTLGTSLSPINLQQILKNSAGIIGWLQLSQISPS
jgi:hypothetical protein